MASLEYLFKNATQTTDLNPEVKYLVTNLNRLPIRGTKVESHRKGSRMHGRSIGEGFAQWLRLVISELSSTRPKT